MFFWEKLFLTFIYPFKNSNKKSQEKFGPVFQFRLLIISIVERKKKDSYSTQSLVIIGKEKRIGLGFSKCNKVEPTHTITKSSNHNELDNIGPSPVVWRSWCANS